MVLLVQRFTPPHPFRARCIRNLSRSAGELPLWERLLPETRDVSKVGLGAGPLFYKALDTKSMCSAAFSSDAQKPVVMGAFGCVHGVTLWASQSIAA
jgi:hypothetical protein